MEKLTSNNTFSQNIVRNLKIDIGCAKIYVEMSPDDDIHVKAELLEDSLYTCEMREDTLYISHEWHRKYAITVPHMHEESLIVLFLPENASFAQIDCNIGAGKMKMNDVLLSCENMKIDIGAGKWKAKQLHVAGKLTIAIGAGKVKLENARTGNLLLDCGAGKIFYKGRIDNNCTVGCGVGSCIFQLENKESDFDYDIACALGSIKVNDRKCSSLGSEKRRSSTSAIGTAKLECGVGSIIWKTT
ncbi:MAG: DUF4097 family beta strand repeat-containing protein [Lachnospiraceae bacterium]|nr:DUF4097 family beta strand repeat-containing protein [Lachnospiraceae bacterium]